MGPEDSSHATLKAASVGTSRWTHVWAFWQQLGFCMGSVTICQPLTSWVSQSCSVSQHTLNKWVHEPKVKLYQETHWTTTKSSIYCFFSLIVSIWYFHLYAYVCYLFSLVQLFVTPGTVARQAPLSMEFSRQGYWSGLPFPSPGDLPDPGIEPRSPTLQADVLPSELLGKPSSLYAYKQKHRTGYQRMRWLDGITDAMDMNVGKPNGDGEWQTWHAIVHGVTTSWTGLGNWTTNRSTPFLW